MKVTELDNVPPSDDLLLQIEQFKMGLISRATGGSIDATEYTRLRKIVLGLPGVENIVPHFLRLCRTPDEFWAWIKQQAQTYAERKVIIAEALNPILEMLEYETGEGALEFKRTMRKKRLLAMAGLG